MTVIPMHKDHFLLHIIDHSRTFRRHRMQQFIDVMNIGGNDSILDVGGLPEIWLGTGLESNVSLLNLNTPSSPESPFTWIAGDACNLNMLDDKSFNVIFSNSVIEHVGDSKRQLMMANEVRRVGKKYWVQTPCKNFPLEVHFNFPFYSFFPRNFRILIARLWPFSYAKFYGLDPVFEAENIWPLNRSEMQALFSDAQIVSERLLGFTKSLIAVKT